MTQVSVSSVSGVKIIQKETTRDSSPDFLQYIFVTTGTAFGSQAQDHQQICVIATCHLL
jgi:hypothetical protein